MRTNEKARDVFPCIEKSQWRNDPWILFSSDEIGSITSDCLPVPWRKQHISWVGEAATNGCPVSRCTCHVWLTWVFLFGLWVIFILCAHSSIGFAGPAPNPIFFFFFFYSSHIFSVVNYFGFCFTSTHLAEAKTPVLPITIVSPGKVLLLHKVSSNILNNARGFFLPYLIWKILNAKSS